MGLRRGTPEEGAVSENLLVDILRCWCHPCMDGQSRSVPSLVTKRELGSVPRLIHSSGNTLWGEDANY